MTDETRAKTAGEVPVMGGIVPYLQLENATEAAHYYERAFGASIRFAFPPDDKGRTMHIHLHLNGGSLMLSDAYPEHGVPHEPAQGYTLHLKVTDVDRWWQRAVEAGCDVRLPLQKMFWGDRYGQLRDPYGVSWSMGEPDA